MALRDGSAQAPHVVRTASLLAITLLLFASSADAGPADDQDPHVRPLTPCDDAMIDNAADQSPTVRALLRRIDQSDVVVYVRCAHLNSALIAGRLMFLSAVAHRRYVIIDLRIPEQWTAQVSTIAHELQHAVEIAETSWIRSSESMARYYGRAGITISTHPLAFETDAARAIGDQARREVFVAAAFRATSSQQTAAPRRR